MKGMDFQNDYFQYNRQMPKNIAYSNMIVDVTDRSWHMTASYLNLSYTWHRKSLHLGQKTNFDKCAYIKNI